MDIGKVILTGLQIVFVLVLATCFYLERSENVDLRYKVALCESGEK